MKSKILSLNVGGPREEEWNGVKIRTSMRKSPVAQLEVGQTSVAGDSFNNPEFHGTPDSVLYIFGKKSVLEYMRAVGRGDYEPGALGENILVEDLDEKQVSVGDIFRIGEVQIQATYPRIPCGKLNIRMQHPQGQRLMQECGRSGVYFRIVKTGTIKPADSLERIEEAKVRWPIFDLYHKVVRNIPLTPEERDRAVQNGAFPQKVLQKWRALKA